MDLRALAHEVEFSEARAYASLLSPPASLADAAGLPRAVRIGSAVALIAPVVTSSLNLNRVIGLGLHEPCDEPTLDAVAALYEDSRISYAIEISPAAQPPELGQWLRARRLRRLMPTAMYLCQVEDAPGPVDGLIVSPARDQREVHAATMLCCGVFRMPAAAQAMLNATWYDKRWTVWVARNGVNVIGAALSFVAQGLAWFGWDATLPDHRGQGVHHALIAARLNQAREQGCRIATAETATHVHDRPDPSGRNYEKLGFVLAYSRHTYAAMRPAVRPMGPLG